MKILCFNPKRSIYNEGENRELRRISRPRGVEITGYCKREYNGKFII
jgi:hypothetical protein